MRFVRETLAMAALSFQLAIVLGSWGQLPRRIPVHFAGNGIPDSYGDKSQLLVVPVIAAFVYAMITVLSFFPQSFNYPVQVTDRNRARLQSISVEMLGWLKAEITCSMAYITWRVVRVTLGLATGLGVAFLPAMLITVGATVVMAVFRMRRAA